MKAVTRPQRFLLIGAGWSAALLALLLSFCAQATTPFESAKRRGKLIVAIDYLAPEYKAGTKFRTPDTIDTAVAEALAKRLQLPLETVQATASRSSPTTGADLIVALADAGKPPPDMTAVASGYDAAPMAIMRTDTTIKTWEDLKGRTVCLAEGGRYVGMLAARYGAIEKVQRAPADSLLNLRIGKCDAAVHDRALLEALLTLPEWKKFSARLPAGPVSPLMIKMPKSNAAAAKLLTSITTEWRNRGDLKQLTLDRARAIAFEVYLDQDVPDCH